MMTAATRDEPRTQIKKFGTIVSELDRLATWLVDEIEIWVSQSAAIVLNESRYGFPFETQPKRMYEDSR